MGDDGMFWLCVLGMVIAYYVFEWKKMEMQNRKAGMLKESQATADLLLRVEKMEKRMANLETIVLEAEKRREFEHRL